MKKIIIALLVALIAIATTEAGPREKAMPKKHATEHTSKQKADEQVADEQATETETAEADLQAENAEEETEASEGKIRFGKDWLVIKKNGKDVKINAGDLSRLINQHLDDTILSAYDDASEDVNEENEVVVRGVGEREYNLAQDGMNLARDISTAFFISIVWIVGLSLLFYYLHRRRKYKTVDRAIQAGYPLPDEFFGKRSQPTPQQPTNVYVTQVPPMQRPANGTQPADAAQPAAMNNYGQSSNPLNNITDWTPFKSGITTTAVGLGLLFFFWILGVTPLAALMVIVIFIGLGKLFIAYQEQQSAKNYWQQQQWTQQSQQEQPQWQQWTPQEQEDVPPMPETPPEFDPTNNE